MDAETTDKGRVIDTSLSKAIIAGLLVGIIAAVLNLVYTIIYRESTGYALTEFIMPLTIFVGFPVLLMLGGCAYYLILKHLRGGNTWYVLLCILLLAALVVFTVTDTERNIGTPLAGLRGLCLGLEIITCVLAAVCIPYLARHPKIYM